MYSSEETINKRIRADYMYYEIVEALYVREAVNGKEYNGGDMGGRQQLICGVVVADQAFSVVGA